MEKDERLNLYRQAIEKWGLSLQLGMLMEECAELIQATHKEMREESPENLMSMASEIADVEIMIEQLTSHFKWQCTREDIEQHKEKKLQRLKKRLGQ